MRRTGMLQLSHRLRRTAAWFLISTLSIPAGLCLAEGPSSSARAKYSVYVKRDTPVTESSSLNKRALVVGVGNYYHCPPLTVTTQDAHTFADFLKKEWKFDSVIVMTDDATDPRLLPTGNNLKTQI